MPIQVQVSFSAETDSNSHKLEIIANDRPGLLAMLARKFLSQSIELHNAKINTLGNRAEDTFLISAKKGQKLNELSIKALHDLLIQCI